MDIFNEIDKFFTSISNYLSFNIIFEIFAGLFLLTVLVVIISTSNSYEAKLIKSIDMFNNYFINNPQITEDNLIPFNNKMKSKKVPKQLRKQWQQFVLYREDKASHYMSFESCVSTPIKNSTYNRDVKVMNTIAYILAITCLLFNVFKSYSSDFVGVMQECLLCPILILLVNFIVTIFLNLRHNAIVSDLNSNYQYFEINMDKATQTLPEYVDYEVLFDRNEIKRGIPILYAYLQKRAEEEQKELERARLKNVEHEKFNFDEAGVASSLVLERAMQEAENYIAERKKYLQDIEQINADITQEETNFREITKEYQRQMQVSKETFENFKQGIENASSSIEVNYLKKQQQQELDRQRNLERDYDTATDRHKKLLDNYQQELTNVENMIKEARTSLEKAMMSEFDTYSNKVYDEAYKTVEERESEKTEKLNSEIKTLSEEKENLNNQLKQKEEELSKAQQFADDKTKQNENLVQQINELNTSAQQSHYAEAPQYYEAEPEYQPEEQVFDEQYESQDYAENSAQQADENTQYAEETFPEYSDETLPEENYEQVEQPAEDYAEPTDASLQEQFEEFDDDAKNVFNVVEDKPKKKAGRPKKAVTEKPAEKKSVGRPKKAKAEEVVKEKKQRGRPKKATATPAVEKAKPEVKETVKLETKSKRGRPKKETTVEVKPEVKGKRGRPKKQTTETAEKSKTDNKPKSKRGRPKKVENLELKSKSIEDIDEYLKQIDDQIAKENAKLEASKKRLDKISKKK